MKDDYIEDEFELYFYESEEIIFEFNINNSSLSEEEFLSQLVRIQDSEVEEYDTEHNLLKKLIMQNKHTLRHLLFIIFVVKI